MTTAANMPNPGQIARVRQRLYLVEATVPPPQLRDCTLVRLSCVDDDAQGQQIEVLWEKEVDAEVLSGEAWDAIAKRGFDEQRVFAAYLHTLRWNCVTSTDPRLFQSPFRAGIRRDAYQMEPLRKALLLPRVNLFIADDVGLGKTIEAGLIARELLLRKKVREIVVSCPPSMLLQWKDELETRFGLVFEILDKDYMKRVRRERGFGINPWGTHSRFLISHRLLIDEAYTGPLRDWLGTFHPGTLFILDEAHHAAPSSGQKYAIDSQITRAVRDLAPRFEHRLFLSATPHNGHSNSFSALLEILERRNLSQQRQAVRREVLVQLVAETPFDLPTDLVSRQEKSTLRRIVSQMKQEGFNENDIRAREAEIRANAHESTLLSLKEFFILAKIAEAEDIKVEDEDLELEIESIANRTDESPRRVRARVEKEGLADALASEILERKTLDRILEFTKTEDVPLEEQAAVETLDETASGPGPEPVEGSEPTNAAGEA